MRNVDDYHDVLIIKTDLKVIRCIQINHILLNVIDESMVNVILISSIDTIEEAFERIKFMVVDTKHMVKRKIKRKARHTTTKGMELDSNN